MIERNIADRARILEAWKEAGSIAGLKKHVAEGREKLFPRFAEHYEKLRALPRRMRRAMQRRWKHTLAGVALMMALSSGSAVAATINVDAAVTGVNILDGQCSLIEAIINANDNITGSASLELTCELGTPNGADNIVLPMGSTFTLTTSNNSTYGATGLPVISSEITIQGNGSTITRSSESNFRIIAVNGSGNLTLQSTTISGGSIDATIGGLDDGGGIANYGGTVTLTNSTLTGNMAADYGGGVYNLGGTMTLTNSTVLGNSATNGGGVYNFGTMTLTNSTVSGNSASVYIGGMSNFGTMTLTNSTVSGNSATFYGGVFNNDTMTLTNSTVSGNSANNSYGGVANVGTMTLTNSAVSGNSANINYGGVYNYGTMTLSRTLISGNTGGSSPEVYNFTGGTINANDYNLFGSNDISGTNFTPAANDIVPGVGVMVSDILAPLALNPPGTTQTHALVTGSPAINASPDDAACQATDQRGVARPQDGDNDSTALCDIGAFELEAAVLTCGGLPITAGCTVNRTPGQPCMGTPDRDTITGTPGDDVISGMESRDTLSGLGGNDTICGDAGNDNISGGDGNDTLDGMWGNDTMGGGKGKDDIFGGDGNDTLRGDSGNDRLVGSSGDDTLNGGVGIDDDCDGGFGADSAAGCENTTGVP